MRLLAIHLVKTPSAEAENGIGQSVDADKTGERTMKNNQPDNLSNLLKEWQPEPMAAGRIRAGVWSRIEMAAENPMMGMAARIASWFERPVFTAGVVAVALVVGITFGSATASQVQTESYLQSLVAFRH